jgi:hypothetical protein
MSHQIDGVIFDSNVYLNAQTIGGIDGGRGLNSDRQRWGGRRAD